MTAPIFYSKIQLARELKIDPRKLTSCPLIPAVNDASGKPLYDLESARAQYLAYIEGKEKRKELVR